MLKKSGNQSSKEGGEGKDSGNGGESPPPAPLNEPLLGNEARTTVVSLKENMALTTALISAGMDWLCPGYSQVLAKQLTTYHGNVTAENTIHNIVSIVQTGDLHVAVYDLPNELLYVANAKADSESGPLHAYDRWDLNVVV